MGRNAGHTPRERLLGFDARVLPGLALGRRFSSGTLLRDDVDTPFSVEENVWPSVFECGGLSSSDLPFKRISRPPESIGANAELWDDLTELRRHLAEWPSPEVPDYVLIAVSWFSFFDFRDAGKYGPQLSLTEPARRDIRRPRLGFDVADEWLDSGLSNMWSDDTIGEARNRFGRELNEHHLFDTLDAAFEFRGMADHRVPTHAPFLVLGLFELERSRRSRLTPDR